MKFDRSLSLCLCLALMFATLSVHGAGSAARIQGLVLDADEMFRDSEKDTVDLTGHVQIVAQDRHLQADEAHLSLGSRKVDLRGNVRLTTPTSTIGGDRMILDYESSTGLIYNGFVQSGPVSFEGALIQRTGPDDYFVLDADYTSCTNCPATWSFHGSTIRAELGGYAYIKNSWFRVGNVRVFWLPYLVVPLKSDRQSGLLTPSIEHDPDGGLAIAQPYFWAISRSTDATITGKIYELRGPKLLGEYRYALSGQDNGGVLEMAAMRDRVFSDQISRDPFHMGEKSSGFDRWFLQYNHYNETEGGWVHRVSMKNASDLRYPKDFPLETSMEGDTSMETRVSVTKNTEESHFSIDSSYYKNLIEGDPLAGNENSVHRLPEIRYAQVTQAIPHTPLFYSLNLDYTNFARSGPGYDTLRTTSVTNPANGVTAPVRLIDNTCFSKPGHDPLGYGNTDPSCQRRDAPFSETDSLIRTGQRLVFEPSLTLPFSIGNLVDVLPSLAYNETHYSFPAGLEPDYVSHYMDRYIRLDLATRTSFSHVYGDLDDRKSTRYKHEIRPEIRYRTLPWIDRKRNPFFGDTADTQATSSQNVAITDADLLSPNGLQFDYEDRLYDRNLITYALVNTLTEKTWKDEKPVYKQLALLQLAQTYDAFTDSFSRTTHPYKQPWSDISALLDLRFDHVQSYSLINYFPYDKVWKSASRLRVKDDVGRFIEVGLTKDYTISPVTGADTANRVEDYSLASGLVTERFNFMERVTFNAAKGGVKSYGYILQLKPPGGCWVIDITQSQLVGSSPHLEAVLEFNFDGAPQKPLPPEALDRFNF